MLKEKLVAVNNLLFLLERQEDFGINPCECINQVEPLVIAVCPPLARFLWVIGQHTQTLGAFTMLWLVDSLETAQDNPPAYCSRWLWNILQDVSEEFGDRQAVAVYEDQNVFVQEGMRLIETHDPNNIGNWLVSFSDETTFHADFRISALILLAFLKRFESEDTLDADIAIETIQ